MLGKEELSLSIWAMEDILANEGACNKSDSNGYKSMVCNLQPLQQQR